MVLQFLSDKGRIKMVLQFLSDKGRIKMVLQFLFIRVQSVHLE
jgi:hypothetical protein